MTQQQQQPQPVHRKWSSQEEAQLLNEISDPAHDIEAIAKTHGRNAGGIKIRIRKLAAEAIDKEPGNTEEILKKFNLTIDEIASHKKLTEQKQQGITTEKQRLDKIKHHINEINKLFI